MKKFLIAGGIVVILGVVIVLIVFQMTAGVVDVAENFFAEVSQGNLEEAYDQYLSVDFKASTSLPEMKRFLEQSALLDYSGASWSSRSVANEQGELEGSIETSTGGTIPIKITLIKEDGAWKILSVYKPPAGVLAHESAIEIPPVADLNLLVNTSILDLAQAINSGDFSAFHKKIAGFWSEQTTPDELKAGFTKFIDQKIDLTGIQGLDPVFSEAASLNEYGALVLKGNYPTTPSAVNFDLSYAFENEAWKLVGIAVDVR